ncbi:uncharacterized protein MONBRDRAFT_36426 [Monosiga brevicollis MX1]|uniref:Protein kinase domain-containing protein n=1 Tax=Monosiga brevicollis TaxID=81824 RepID=A9UUG4_MONBE|nr:uncharacterized protein MONBRDRAFT_36426 [Monosiga brevicollis MX1]EDQ91094.1 predicted protein [Monosiga brevicollis MX1]|eukprot:XP_001744391.1 hypothetical protein [Monosiga brevicollis MX1]
MVLAMHVAPPGLPVARRGMLLWMVGMVALWGCAMGDCTALAQQALVRHCTLRPTSMACTLDTESLQPLTDDGAGHASTAQDSATQQYFDNCVEAIAFVGTSTAPLSAAVTLGNFTSRKASRLNLYRVDFSKSSDWASLWTALPNVTVVQSDFVLPAYISEAVTHLTLHNLSTVDNRHLPDLLAQLPNLVELHIEDSLLAATKLRLSAPNLRSLRLLQCALPSLDTDLLIQAPSLIELNLSSNNIVSVSASALRAAPALVNLTLANNRLTTLPGSFLSSMTQLTFVDLGHNRLTDWPSLGANLKHVFLNNNRLSTLGPLHPTLQTASCRVNAIKSVSSPVCVNGASLTSLDLGLNRPLPSLTTADLSNCHQLLTLYLDGTNANVVREAGLLRSLTRLERLSLANMALQSLPELAQLTALRELDLTANVLTTLALPSLPRLSTLAFALNAVTELVALNLPALQMLNGSSNALASIDSALFAKSSELRELILSHNALTAVPPTPQPCRLIELWIDDNALQTLDGVGLERCFNLTTLAAMNNQLTAMPASLVQALSRLETLLYRNNPVMDLEASTFNTASQLTTLSIQWNRGGDFDLNWLASCSSLLSFLLASDRAVRLRGSLIASNLQFLSLSGLQLTEAPPLPLTISKVDVSNNSITSLPAVSLNHFPQLFFLNLSGNRELEVDTDFLMGSKQLQFVDLSSTRSLLKSGDICRSMPNLTAIIANDLSEQAADEGLADFITGCALVLNILDLSKNAWLNNVSFMQAALQSVEIMLTDNSVDNKPFAVVQLHDLPLLCLHEERPASIFDTSLGIALFVVFTLMLAVALGYGIWRAIHWLFGMREELELRERLLADAEDDVIALKQGWHIDAEDIILGRRIDVGYEGAFGDVYQGQWNSFVVAVKVAKARVGPMQTDERAMFQREVDFVMRASHPCLVHFFGFAYMDDRPALVLEFVELGSLDRLCRETPELFDWPRRCSLALDVARGMRYVHEEMKSMHRDLKPGNVLVTRDWRGKVNDFGSMKYCFQRYQQKFASTSGRDFSTSSSPISTPNASLDKTVMVGTPLYAAPEVLEGSKTYDRFADVWSFAVLMWEMSAHRIPDLLAHREAAEGVTFRGPYLSNLAACLADGHRLPMDESWPASWRSTMTLCWAQEPELRPSFAEIVLEMSTPL